MTYLADHPQGCTVSVRAQPRAKRAAMVGVRGDALKLSVTAPPEDGRANQALVELLSETLGVARNQIELLRGAMSRDKLFLIRGVTRAELAVRLERILHHED